MPDTGGFEARDASLAIALKQETEQVAEIVRILNELDIYVDRVTEGREGSEDKSGLIVVRIASNRVLDAVMALGYHGFRDVRAYGAEGRTAWR